MIFIFMMLSLTLSAKAGGNSTHRDSTRIEHRFGLNVRPGILSRHHDFFKGENSSGKPMLATASCHLQYSFRFPANSNIGKLYPSSYQGVGIAGYEFGNFAELGSPVALYVFQGGRIASLGERFSLDYEWNFGASFGWHPFVEEGTGANPLNMITGTKVNAYLNTGFFISWYPVPQWTLSAGVDMTHFSNGDTTFPNSGVNSLALRVGAVYSMDGPQWKIGRRHYGTCDGLAGKAFADRMTIDVLAFGAWNEEKVEYLDKDYLAEGKFGVAGLHVNPLYSIFPWLAVGAALDIQYNEGMNIQNHIAGVKPGTDEIRFYRPPFGEQFGVGLSLRAELRMPVFAVNAGIGHNVIYRGRELSGLYGLLSLKTFVSRNLFLNVGLKMCSRECSNNLILGLGWRFSR